MNPKFLIKISNIIGLISIGLLVYWVFTFVLILVFGLKIFRQYMTEIFMLSILGILALMGGALILNIMFNLTRIAERGLEVPETKTPKKTIYACLALFPLIACILFGGNYLTEQKKQQLLVQSAENMITTEKNRFQLMSNYQFNTAYLKQTSENLKFLSILDPAFADVQVIVPDQIQNNHVFLSFNSSLPLVSNAEQRTVEQAALEVVEAAQTDQPVAHKISLDKQDYVRQLSLKEKEYLKSVFEQGNREIKFEADDGNYQLFYPYKDQNKTIVLYFSDRQRYGKLGS